MNVNLRIHGKVEDRKKVVSELGDMENPRKLNKMKILALPNRDEEDSTYPY